MSVYTVATGDTFDIISRKRYGVESNAGRIASANPGVMEPLVVGTTVVIPDDATQVDVVQPTDAAGDVLVIIDGVRFRFWAGVRVTRSLDNMSTIELVAPSESSRDDFRKTFTPFAFKTLAVILGGEPLFTGVIVGIDPMVDPSQKTISISGYSQAAVLNDCTAPGSAYPLEFNGQGLQEIASTLASPFGLAVEFTADAGPIFDRVAIDPTANILPFLADLAKQRNLVIADTPRGGLLFQQSVSAGNPVVTLQQGVSPLLSVEPTFNPQEYFSHITGIEPVGVGGDGAQYTVKNPLLSGVLRPMTFTVQDSEGGDLQTAVEAKMGRMFANMVSYSVRLTTWLDSAGAVWTPNTTVRLLAPDALIYNYYEFIIRSVQLEHDGDIRVATLDIVLPGAFAGEIPEVLPWGV